MPIFITDEELSSLHPNNNNNNDIVTLIISKADSYITNLQRQLETVKAQSDASSITAEQTCSLLEQKYISLSSDFEKLEKLNDQLHKSIEQNLEELAVIKSEKHQLHLNSIEKDGAIERLSAQVLETHKSKRQLLSMIEQKDSEITEKNTTINTYLDRIVKLTEAAALKQSQLHDREAEFARSQATCARISQEKELIEKHNAWLNEELTAKVRDLIEVRKSHTEAEADISTKLADAEKSFNECASSLKWSKERVKELEGKLASLQEELCFAKTTAAENEERFTAELSTVTKLVELYKESSEEWSRKAGDLEGVIKALETHVAQFENDYKEKLEKEVSARQLHEKVAADLKEKLDKYEVEIENYRKANELSLLPISSFTEERWTHRSEVTEFQDSDHSIVPKIPSGVSGTALAASLLRDGWSLAKMYEKYQEAVDALRHETMGRKQSQAVLERVLYEIEQKAELILDERAEHERMVEAYSVMNQKLEGSTSEQVKLEGTIQELKAEIRRSEREYDMAQMEIVDLQKQVTVLLKECRDVQLRCGSPGEFCVDQRALLAVGANDLSDIERVISERLTYKDINQLVEHNVKLRSLVRNLSDQNEKRDTELREMFEMELRKQTDEAASKVAVVLQRAEEQGQMIESLHRSVAMYKRLYEEEQKLQASHPHYAEAVPDSRRNNVILLEDSQDASKKAHEKLVERAKCLEEQLDVSRKEIISLRLERDKLSMESKFAQDKLDGFMKEFEHQRAEMNRVLSRNVEFSQLVVDYQRKVRESSDSLQAAEDLSRKLTMEVSRLKCEKESLLNSEKRTHDEARNLSERVRNLQTSMETKHCVEEAREEARVKEQRKQEEHMNTIERDLAQVMKERQEKSDEVRTLTLEKHDAMKRIEELEKQLADALRDLADALRNVASAESRAAVAEARHSDRETRLRVSHDKVLDGGDGPSTSLSTENGLPLLKEEIERLKEEAKANKDHMLQYKNIAQVNELALKQVESAHERFKTEADRIKKSLEDEVLSLRERITELENEFNVKFKEAATTLAGKEEALNSALAEMDILKAENCSKVSLIAGMEVRISSMKEDLEKEHQRWRDAQTNYERQVILQSDTIQELTKTSHALSLVQDEVSQLRKLSDTQKSENDILKEKLASEISLLGKLKDDAERKYNEVNEQNKILHSRLESLHIKLADKERTSAGISGSPAGDAQGDDGLQSVVTYLRRSKEIAETEISLLKQEKMRLQSQFESALKASEMAQAQLHSERVKSRELLFSDEDFKALQIQVRELNLLRESNLQLREENKHNFEECQRLRELAQKASVEMDHLETMLEEKKIEVDSCRKEIETQVREKGSLENRIVELLRLCKNISIEDYNHMKEDTHQMQVKLKTVEAELDECRKLLLEKHDSITSLELQLKNTRMEVTERETRIKESLQVEANLKLELEKHKSELEKHRKAIFQFKRKCENLTKQKEELTKEKQTLVKQEESRQGKRPLGDTSSEQAMKEKDARIQILERTIEREREELRKEKEEHRNEKEEHRKAKEEHLKEKEEHHKEKEKNHKEKEEFRKMRLKSQKTFEELLNRANQERVKLFDELEKHKQGCWQESGVLDNPTTSYSKAVDDLNESVKLFVSDELGAPDHSLDTSRTDRLAAAAQQVPAQTIPSPSLLGTVVGSLQTKPAEEKGRRANLAKPQSESRKVPRRLVRPNLGPRPQETSGDTEMAYAEGSAQAEGKKGSTSLNSQPSAPARKRGASDSASELPEESEIQSDTSNVLVPPVSKKSRAEVPQEGTEGQVSAPTHIHDVPSSMDESFDAAGDQPHTTDESVIFAEKDDISATVELEGESKESPSDVLPLSETQNNDPTDGSELFDNIRETEDDVEEQDPQQTMDEVESDREEGELPADMGDEQDGVDEPGEVEQDLTSVPDIPSSAVDEELDFTASELFETSSTVMDDEKVYTGEMAEEVAEDSDKSTNDFEQGLEIEKSPKADFGAVGSSSPSNVSDIMASDQSTVAGAPAVEGEGSPAGKSRTINLIERAKAKAELRRKGLAESLAIIPDSSTAAPTPAPKREATRGVRGARAVRGRVARGGRRPASNDGQG